MKEHRCLPVIPVLEGKTGHPWTSWQELWVWSRALSSKNKVEDWWQDILDLQTVRWLSELRHLLLSSTLRPHTVEWENRVLPDILRPPYACHGMHISIHITYTHMHTHLHRDAHTHVNVHTHMHSPQTHWKEEKCLYWIRTPRSVWLNDGRHTEHAWGCVSY